MRSLRSAGQPRSVGQLEKLLVIGLGLAVVLLVPFVRPVAEERGLPAGGSGRVSPTGTPTGAAGPAAVTTGAATPTPAGEAAATPEPTRAGPQPDPPYFRVVAGGSGANLRSAPSTTAPVVMRLRDGAVVTNLDQQQSAEGLSWRRVAEGDVDGWIAAELLAPQQD